MFGAHIYDTFLDYDKHTFIVPDPDFDNATFIGYHAMILISYDDTIHCFGVCNSWGK